MDSSQYIFYMIIICLAGILIMLFSKQIKYLLRFLINAVAGIAGILLVNIITGMFGLTAGVNYLTILVTGILGLPGFILIYVTQALL